MLFDCQGLFFFLCTTFSCVCRVSVFLQEVGEIVQGHSEVFKKKFWCSQGQTKVFFFIFCDRSQTILVKHPFPLSHIRALTILLFESMAIYKGPLLYSLYLIPVGPGNKRLKSKYKLSALTGLTLMQLPL